MTVKEKIQKELNTIMDEGEANACRVYKANDYDGSGQWYGWWYCKFDETPTYLGMSLDDALATISAIGDDQETEGKDNA